MNGRSGKALLPRLLPVAASRRHVQQEYARLCGAFLHGPGWNRTNDLGIKSPLLCQLSYRPVLGPV